MVYDSMRSRAILFGGGAWDGQTYFDDTWVWNGVDWLRVTTTHAPPGRAGHALAYDPVRDRVVMFGGADAAQSFGDTWEFDGVDWNPLRSPTSPTPRTWLRMSYSPGLGGVVLFGGEDGCAEYDEVWLLSSGAWQLLSTPSGPSPRGDSGWALHPTSGAMLAFGGRTSICPQFVMSDDAWWFDRTTSSYGVYRASCSSSVGTPRLTANAPIVGQAWTITVTGLAPSTVGYMIFALDDQNLGLALLPLNLAIVGAPGCFLNVNSDPTTGATTHFMPASASGVATAVITIPGVPAVFGFTFFNQYVSIDAPSGRFLGITTTNAGRGVVGF